MSSPCVLIIHSFKLADFLAYNFGEKVSLSRPVCYLWLMPYAVGDSMLTLEVWQLEHGWMDGWKA